MTFWLDGRLVVDGPPEGRGVFETLGLHAGTLPLWGRHLARLARGAAAVRIACEPPADLLAAATELLRAGGHDVLRISLTAGAAGDPSWRMTTRLRQASAAVRLIEVRGDRPAGAPPAEHKCTSRSFYDEALRCARAAGSDDALLVAGDGAVLETTTANVFAMIGDELWTPSLDGRLLPGIARQILLDALPIHERMLTRDDLAGASGMWVSNAVHGPRPATLPGRAASSDPRLRAAWVAALACIDG